MTEIATIDWFGRWGTSVFSENTAIFNLTVSSASRVHSTSGNHVTSSHLQPNYKSEVTLIPLNS